MDIERTDLDIEKKVMEAGAPLLGDLGLELWDVHWGGGRLRLTVDCDGGVGSEALVLASRTISAELDAMDPIPGRYTLEVSSPGLERRLRRPEHFRKALGSDIAVKMTAGWDGDRRVRGCLAEAGETHLTLRMPDGERRDIPLTAVSTAKTVIDWDSNPLGLVKDEVRS